MAHDGDVERPQAGLHDVDAGGRRMHRSLTLRGTGHLARAASGAHARIDIDSNGGLAHRSPQARHPCSHRGNVVPMEHTIPTAIVGVNLGLWTDSPAWAPRRSLLTPRPIREV